MKVAKLARESIIPLIVSGDFNNVTWSKVSRLFSKISNLKDVRLNNNRTDLIIDVQSDFYPLDGSGENLATNIYNSLEGKRFQLDRLDNVKVIVNYGFQMTLAKYTLTFSKNWAQ